MFDAYLSFFFPHATAHTKKTAQTIHLCCLYLSPDTLSVIEHHRHEQHEQLFVLSLFCRHEHTST